MAKRLRDLLNKLEAADLPLIEDVTITSDDETYQRLYEGRLISGRFDRNIRIDQPTHLHGAGSVHAHVCGRKGKELVVVNLTGTPSHGSKGRLHPRDAEALRAQGFTIRDDGIVECFTITGLGPEILLG